MNLLYPRMNTKPTGLLNTQPMTGLTPAYQNLHTPRLLSPEVETPIVEMPVPDYGFGASPGDTQGNGLDANNGTQDIADMTTADIEAAIDQTTAIGIGIPGMGLPAAFSTFMMNQELQQRSDFGMDGNGNHSTDPSAPGGIGGSAGDAAATGSGGFGPEMGGDGGFGL